MKKKNIDTVSFVTREASNFEKTITVSIIKIRIATLN